MSIVESFEPRPLWKHFDEILEIPRGSGNEEQIRRYVLGVAQRHELAHEVDATGNVVIVKPASPGHEGAAGVVLQSHLDMVNEKNSDVDHDFDKDPIRPQVDGEYLKATGTTLGSDNGIGVATMLALAEADEFVHGPLELLFTVDEETGLTGAGTLANDMLTGRTLINLDSEEEGVLTIGCAGGADTRLTLELDSEDAPQGWTAFEVRLAGLKGGHSGVDIHLQRGNAVQLLARALQAAARSTPLRLAHFQGGNKHNAIPREAGATVLVGDGAAAEAKDRIQAEFDKIREEFGPADPDASLTVAAADRPARTWTAATSARLLNLLNALPHGVQSMSYDIPGLVETSTNLATASPSDASLSILMSSRSSVASALDALRQRIRAAGELAGATVEEGGGYPGWKPNVESRLLGVVKDLHTKTFGQEPEVTAVHAGLECGIIGEKYPGMDMISFGPQIEFPHSPDERVKIASVGEFFRLLTVTLAALA